MSVPPRDERLRFDSAAVLALCRAWVCCFFTPRLLQMARSPLCLAILLAGWQLQGVISCDCSWTNNGENCGNRDDTVCWPVCCPNSCNAGGWAVAYSAQRCHMSNGVRRISCDGPSMHQCGTRLSAPHNFVGRGYHSVRIKAAPGPGVVTTFYLSNNGGLYDKTKTHPWVELDFEIMGNMAGPGGQSRIWTNMFTGIAVEHNQWIIVPFDVTQDYHEYGFDLGDNSISFKVDGVAYRTTDIQNYDDVRASIWSTNFQEFVSVWGQSSQDPGEGVPDFQNAMGLLDANPYGFPRYAEAFARPLVQHAASKQLFQGWAAQEWRDWVAGPDGSRWCENKRYEADRIVDWMVCNWGLQNMCRGSGVLDVGGEPGFLASALLARGVGVTVVDPTWRITGKAHASNDCTWLRKRRCPEQHTTIRLRSVQSPVEHEVGSATSAAFANTKHRKQRQIARFYYCCNDERNHHSRNVCCCHHYYYDDD
eukprot:s574_g13.t1